MSAHYLLRFDDICPTMNWTIWRDIEHILITEGIKPILAVIPDNQDPTLKVDVPMPDFWQRVRNWQAQGWSIGLHGYQHRYVTKNSGLIGRNQYSEFAGLSYIEQSLKLQRGLEVFRREDVRPDLWIAPAHSYDETTLDLLATWDIRVISDGYAMFPYVDQRKLLCIPQQFGKFRWVPLGVWTVCMHHNQWAHAKVRRLQSDANKYKKNIVSLPQVIQRYSRRPKRASDNLLDFGFRTARAIRH